MVSEEYALFVAVLWFRQFRVIDRNLWIGIQLRICVHYDFRNYK